MHAYIRAHIQHRYIRTNCNSGIISPLWQSPGRTPTCTYFSNRTLYYFLGGFSILRYSDLYFFVQNISCPRIFRPNISVYTSKAAQLVRPHARVLPQYTYLVIYTRSRGPTRKRLWYKWY